METIVLKKGVEINLEELTQQLSQLDELVLTNFLISLNDKLNGHTQLLQISEETILLQKIKSVVPASVLRQYRKLRKKAQQQTISDTEHHELLLLSDFIEEKTAEKINLLSKLAQVRQVPLNTILQQFTIQSLV